ncbi:hypothetical protein NM688_g8495 [Phlebia brevispora]|uniref:Uncharacterized protein n=1 Tax=Phlebia brevispora TaxID=194682 RepID=A0ACC1RRH0_9APHY|nr:hypothetical protein NM688_g8495 [Phlebia brevispora]
MREEVLRRIRSRVPKGRETLAKNTRGKHVKSKRLTVGFAESEPMSFTTPDKHYHVSDSNRYFEELGEWLEDNAGDPALVNFEGRLKDHLLRRLSDIEDEDQTFTDEDRRNIVIVGDRLYRHKAIRVNYTTYDLRRAQDSLNPRTHADIMVQSHEDEDERDPHPYWYARIVGVFHVYVQDFRETTKTHERQCLESYGCDGFVNDDDPDAFGFISPDDIIRAAHLIPAFHHGTTDEYLPPSIVRPASDNDEDWVYYYVNIFVDRDMLMRYLGGGIGHRITKRETFVVCFRITRASDRGRFVMAAVPRIVDDDFESF